jgi:hypothetical protein
MDATADAIRALITWLGTQPDIASLTAGRIYGGELPTSEVGTMPKKVILLRWAGGLGISDVILLSNWRVEIWCYGETPYEGDLLNRLVHRRMKSLTSQMIDGVKLYPVQESEGPHNFREPDTKWPATIQSWSSLFADDP